MDNRNRLVVRSPPDEDYALPPAFPLPLSHIEGISRRPFQFNLTARTLENFSIPAPFLTTSNLWMAMVSYCEAAGEDMQGLEIYVVGDITHVIVNLEHQVLNGREYYTFGAENHLWRNFILANHLREGDRVGAWLFTHARYAGLWMAFLVTRLRFA